MCSGCTYAADLTVANRERVGEYVMRIKVPHPCLYPHTCTCQHDRREPVPAERGTDR
jgi:hypothetical protein